MPNRITKVVVPEDRYEKFAAKGLRVSEAIEILVNPKNRRRKARDDHPEIAGRCYVVTGRTESGSSLHVFVRVDGTVARLITAWRVKK